MTAQHKKELWIGLIGGLIAWALIIRPILNFLYRYRPETKKPIEVIVYTVD